MEKYYLIDYENVGSDGLCGCDRLSASDHIYIFFTNNAKKIDMREIADHGEASLTMVEVPAGKQSTDIHIGSFLGYLIGSDKDCEVGIISNDTDFDNVIKFWAKSGLAVSRSKSITVAAVKHKAARQKETGKAKPGQAKKENAPKKEPKLQKETKPQKEPKQKEPKQKEQTKVPAPAKPQNKSEANELVMQTLSKAGFDCETAGCAASLAVKSFGKDDGKQQVYLALVKKYGQKKGLEVYSHIKKKL